MFHLGIPTTRALCLVETGESVIRDLLYDGNARPEPGAVVCRVAPSFLRFGNFEILARRDDVTLLEKLASFTLRTYFPELGEPSPNAYATMLAEISRRTAELIAQWMSVGFVHGVLNTDNMSIIGLTIDYGPYGFLDDYSPAWTPNITDASGRRYRYENQPAIGLWNLTRFAGALHPLVGDIDALEDALRVYGNTLMAAEKRRTARKLGLRSLNDDELSPNGELRIADSALVTDLYELLAAVETDMTIFFRSLARVSTKSARSSPPRSPDRSLVEPLREAFYDPAVPLDHELKLAVWLERYVARVREDGTPDAERRVSMNAENPKYVLRNYVAQLAIDRAEAGDASLVSELLDVLRRPFDEQPENARFAEKRPDWARHKPGCSMLSCSS
jgi:uncharacterized protein YdiU (UPF0061 family)